ncbi:hypothetical protein BC830DRAFT_1085105, partial [Chytriomyces sp. MP71]
MVAEQWRKNIVRDCGDETEKLVLTVHQDEFTFRSMLDTMLPPVKLNPLIEGIDVTRVDRAALESFASSCPSDMGAIDILTALLAKHKTSADQANLRIVLWMLTTGPGTFLLTGHAKPFLQLTDDERANAMLALGNSRINDLRNLFRDIKNVAALSCLARNLKLDGLKTGEGDGNPFWKAMGYPGVPTEKAVQDSFAHVFVPDFMDLDALAKQQGGTTVTLEYDVVVVGSGCGGGVVAGELAKAGHRVLVIEKGTHRRQTDLTNNEMESMFNSFEMNGLLQSDGGE